MAVFILTVTSDETRKHSPPATDLRFGLIILAIYILALICYAISWLLRPYRHPSRDAVAVGYETMSGDDVSELISDDGFEPALLGQISPERTYKQWKAETNDLANIAFGFDTWWAHESSTISTLFSDYFSVQFVWSQC
ncbi:hypothetical protein B0J15DRAFT_400613 [Fusarium solani]|uniref:Uncharacterized protein n=1 Tax=Fusarium solani TaxID=169388 RepID=A0A9P9H1B3_FUSSL|nr:uncharacterized protein B0J15DRAFT_400613 [Fusarium solani]KAH7248409.1 hypothetical protein B0J15DRAFT_400613 [Fusarium solani]